MKTLRVIYAVAIITIISVASDCHALYAYYKKRQEYALRQAHIVQVQQEQADRYAQIDGLLEARIQRIREKEREEQLWQQQLEQELSEQCEKTKEREKQKRASLKPSPDAAPVRLLQEMIFGRFHDFEMLKVDNYALAKEAVRYEDPTIFEFLFDRTGPQHQNCIRDAIIRHAIAHNQYNVISWLFTKGCYYEVWNEAVTQYNLSVMSMVIENRKQTNLRDSRFWSPVFSTNNLYAVNMVRDKINNIDEIINTPDTITNLTLLDEYLQRVKQYASMTKSLIKAGAKLSTNGEHFVNNLLDEVNKRTSTAKMLIAERKAVGLNDIRAIHAAHNLKLFGEVQDIVFDGLECTPEQIQLLKTKRPFFAQTLSEYENAQQVLLERELHGTMLDCEHHIDSRYNAPRCLLNYAKSLFFSWDLSTEENNKNTIQERSVLMPNTVLRIIYGYLGHSSESNSEAPQID